MYLQGSDNYHTFWKRATSHTGNIFIEKEYAYKFSVCEHLGYLPDLNVAALAIAVYLIVHLHNENTVQFKLCFYCCQLRKTNYLPTYLPIGLADRKYFTARATTESSED